MIGYICPRCRRKVPSGKTCPCRMQAYPQGRDKYAFYHSAEWKRLVQAVKIRDGGIDRYAWQVHHVYQRGRIVHHIIPIEEAWDRRFDMDNLILVSDSSHGEIHAQLKAGGESRERVIRTCLDLIADTRGYPTKNDG